MLFSQSIIRILDKYSELGKMGEDEFAVLVSKFNTIKDVKKICNKIHRCFQEPFKIMDHKVYIEVNIGISIFPEHGSEGHELLRYCYFAMNSSKEKGKIHMLFW